MSNSTLQQPELWTAGNIGQDEEDKEERRTEEEFYLAAILHKQVCKIILNR